MKKRNILLAVLLLSVLVLNSYKNDDTSTNPGQAPNEIIPLKVGNYWDFNITHYDESGSITQTMNWHDAIDYNTIIDNQRWYVSKTEYSTRLFTNKSDGYYESQYTGTGSMSAPVLKYKYPGKVGDTWEIDNYTKMRINSTNLKYSIPLGEFSCYEYIYTSNSDLDFYQRILVSPGIGFILNEYYEKKGSSSEYYLSFKEVLTDYKVN